MYHYGKRKNIMLAKQLKESIGRTAALEVDKGNSMDKICWRFVVARATKFPTQKCAATCTELVICNLTGNLYIL